MRFVAIELAIAPLNRTAAVPGPSKVNYQEARFSSNTATISPSPIGWVRVGVHGKGEPRSMTKRPGDSLPRLPLQLLIGLEQFQIFIIRHEALVLANNETFATVEKSVLEQVTL